MKKFDEFITENNSEEEILILLEKIAQIINNEFHGENKKLFQFKHEFRFDGLISFQMFLYGKGFLGGRNDIEELIEDEEQKLNKLKELKRYKETLNMSDIYIGQSIVSGSDIGYHKQYVVKFNWSNEEDLMSEKVKNFVNSHTSIQKYNM